jgi:DNA polymerase I-like protein with 3'-5' exonuclease and polymerase domains
MNLVTLDFETYYDKEYTLKKLTTEGYIRDPRFEVLCMGAKINEEPAYIATGVFNPQNAAILCHHAHFDGLILSHHYNIKPKFWFDTLSMARCAFPHDKSHSLEALAVKFGLGSKTIDYKSFEGKHEASDDLMEGCVRDVELTYSLFKKLLPLVPKEELRVIDLTIRMFTEPMLRLNQPRAKEYMAQLIINQDALLAELNVTKEDLRSADKFAGLLESLGVEPPIKKSPRTGKDAYAFAKTDHGFIELLEHEDERISTLCEARLSAKSTIGETRADRLIGMSERGNLPIYLKYFGAHTGRWSGGDKLNFQNFPRGGELRKSLLAPDGFVLCVVDSSQIECRMLNWLAGEEWVLAAFREGRDLYSETASVFYRRGITKADKQERFLGKTLELGAGYGIGWKKLQSQLKLNKLFLGDEEAKSAINVYRTTHTDVVKLWKLGDILLKELYHHSATSFGFLNVDGRRIVLPNGIRLDYSNIAMSDDGKDFVLRNPKGTVKIYGGKLIENIVQALARVVMSQAMLKIADRYKIILTTHDEAVYLVPEHEAEEALKFGLAIMREVPNWCKGLPLDAEGGYAKEYSK